MVNVGMLQGYEVSVIVIIQSNLPKATTPEMPNCCGQLSKMGAHESALTKKTDFYKKFDVSEKCLTKLNRHALLMSQFVDQSCCPLEF